MDKISYYNINVEYNENMLIYNSLKDSMMYLTKEEFSIINVFLEDLELFSDEYPILYTELKKGGFIISESFNELDYIRFQNKCRVFGSNDYHITINPTLDCNLTCWYCSTEYNQAKHHGSMNIETVNNVIKHIERIIYMQKAASFHLDWFGGEPLMYFNQVIVPISDAANNFIKENRVKFSQHITTNATLLDQHRIEQMKNMNFTSFQIPIDGNEQRHNKVKYFRDKKDTYKLIMNNINMIADIIPNVHITLRINCDKQTLKNIGDILKDIPEKNKRFLWIDFERVWQVPFAQKDMELLKNVKEMFDSNGLRSDFWAYRPQTFFRCYADRFHHYAINYDGRVFKCTARDYGEDKVIGNLSEDGKILWNNELLSNYFCKATFENKRCLECKYLPICMGPCIQKNYDSRINNTDLPCNISDAEYSFTPYLIEQAKKRNLIN